MKSFKDYSVWCISNLSYNELMNFKSCCDIFVIINIPIFFNISCSESYKAMLYNISKFQNIKSSNIWTTEFLIQSKPLYTAHIYFFK